MSRVARASASASAASYTQAWKPTDIAGCQLWYDMRTVVLADGAEATSCPDRSGNGRDGVFPGTGSRPVMDIGAINGRQAFLFDGTNDYFESPSSLPSMTNFTFVLVLKGNTNVTTQQNILQANNASASALYTTGSSQRYLSIYSGANVSSTVQLNDGVTKVWMGTFDSSGTEYQYTNPDATQIATGDGGTGSIATNNRVYIGTNSGASDYFFKGWIGEVLIYDTELVGANRTNLFTYLQDKWGI